MASSGEGGLDPPDPDQEQHKQETAEFLPGFPTLESYSSAALRQILVTTKHANALPGEKRADWDYYDTFAGFRSAMQKQNKVNQALISKSWFVMYLCVSE